MHLMKKNDHGTSHAEITSLTLTRLSDNEILIVDNLIGLKVSLLSWLCLCIKYMVHGLSHLKQMGHCLGLCHTLGSNINDDVRFHRLWRLCG